MKFTDIIQIFPEAIKANSDDFDVKDLQDLDATLAELETQPSQTIEKLKEWFRTHTNVRDTAIQFEKNNRQTTKTSRRSLNSEAEIVKNLFELRQTNRDIINNPTNPSPSDKPTQP